MNIISKRINRILEEIRNYIYTTPVEIENFKYVRSGYNAHEIPGDGEDWMAFKPSDRWGGRDKHYWFSSEFYVPENLMGKELVLEIRTGAEGGWDADNPQFIAYINGELRQGLDINHRIISISEEDYTNGSVRIALHAYSGMRDGFYGFQAQLSLKNSDLEKFYYDLRVPFEAAELLDKEDKNKIDILNYLNNTINYLDLRVPESDEFYQSVKAASRYLDDEFYGKYCGHGNITAACVGHTHIDVAWLWTLAQTREKVARSFSNVLRLMEQYPEYIFMSSQPQLYQFLKEDFPELYQQVKERVKEGRWEPEGAMWLEADCNLTSGESFVRQLMFGLRFFRNEFGVENKVLWLPDVFGYSAALPQILKKSGIDYFMTTKISWNEYNKMPYDTFHWRGIDGTEILTHFITTSNANNPEQHFTTYNGMMNPSEVLGSWQRYQQKDINNEVLICYGYGDGGGGTTAEMLENVKRMSRGIPGCPTVKPMKALDFFKNLEKRVAGNKHLPNWVGELYLEYHRGTYTSMARNKKFNRKSEFLYQDAELFSVLSTDTAGTGTYPVKELNKGWETILLNQFHDILPGSSIKEVYEDSREQYLAIGETGHALLDTALNNISGKIALKNRAVVVFNPLGFERSDLAEVELTGEINEAGVLDMEGRPLVSQLISGEHGSKKLLFRAESIPSKGYKAFSLTSGSGVNSSEQATASVSEDLKQLETRFLKLTFDSQYHIVSIYDKSAGREVIKPGHKGNALQAYEDKPYTYDAWEISRYYDEKMWEVSDVESIELTENGPVRVCLKITRKFLSSVIVQEIYLYSYTARIDFVNKIDWKEKQILLKAAFPVDIHADKATYDIQYGNVERPTHYNTSWDTARFEVCGHKWADISEDGYGVSLLNDCKYGYSIHDSVMQLTLLKSATYPNPDADKEIHTFTYSLYPHQGSWKEAGTVNQAYMLNCPVYCKVEEAHDGTLPEEMSFVSVDSPNVMVEVVKQAEDGNGCIVRMYECHNRRTMVTAETFKSVTQLYETDLMENNLYEISTRTNAFSFEIKPYEIKTFRIV